MRRGLKLNLVNRHFCHSHAAAACPDEKGTETPLAHLPASREQPLQPPAPMRRGLKPAIERLPMVVGRAAAACPDEKGTETSEAHAEEDQYVGCSRLPR